MPDVSLIGIGKESLKEPPPTIKHGNLNRVLTNEKHYPRCPRTDLEEFTHYQITAVMVLVPKPSL